jgi:hypothetical protein
MRVDGVAGGVVWVAQFWNFFYFTTPTTLIASPKERHLINILIYIFDDFIFTTL